MFENWYEKIRSNRENFIEYYVKQFGEENRDLITERFDSLKFCFYIDPEYINLWVSLQLQDGYEVATYNFIKEVGERFGIDVSDVSLKFNGKLGYIFIDSKDEQVEVILRKLFRCSVGMVGISEDYMFYDLYSFRSLEDFMNGEGSDYDDPEKELTERRLLFLKDMGDIIIEGRPIDYFKTDECREFVNSSRYRELLDKYSDLANIAFRYKKQEDSKYDALIDYMKKSQQAEEAIIKKYEELKSKEDNPAKLKKLENECRKEIAALRIVCGNFDLSKYEDYDLAFSHILELINDSGDTQTSYLSCDDSGNLERIIFFCPFKSVPGYEDVDLRHEIRHNITSGVSLNSNEVVYKIGNKIERFIDDRCEEKQLSDWNEWVTQSEAKQETMEAFSKNIYIISKPTIRNQDFIGTTSDYDRYLSLFEIIYNSLPLVAKRSQIYSSNEALYKAISLDQLQDIEDMILNRWNDDETISTLQRISSIIITNSLGDENNILKNK